MTATQAAASLGVCPRTVRRWVASGRIDGHKVGTDYVVAEPSDLIASLARLRGSVPPVVRSA